VNIPVDTVPVIPADAVPLCRIGSSHSGLDLIGIPLSDGFLGAREYFGHAAENDEVVDGLIDLLEMRDGLERSEIR
jgi:hypothetical protein